MARHDDYEGRFGELALLAYQAAFRLNGDRAAAEDIAQETMARAYVRWSRVRTYAEPWVVRVATNQVIGLWRRDRHRDRARAEPVRTDIDETTTQRVSLVAALKSLPRRQREAVSLRYLGDMTIEDTAKAMGCSPSAVKAHSVRGLTTLRRSGVVTGGDVLTDGRGDSAESAERSGRTEGDIGDIGDTDGRGGEGGGVGGVDDADGVEPFNRSSISDLPTTRS